MSEEMIRNILAGNPARESTFASEELEARARFRMQQELEARAREGEHGSIRPTPRTNMEREVNNAFYDTPPGQYVEGRINDFMDSVGDPQPLEPRYNEQGELIHGVTGMPAPWSLGVGGGPKPGGFYSKLKTLFSKPKPTRKPVVSLGGGGLNPERQALLERIEAGRKQDALRAVEGGGTEKSIFATDRPASPEALSNFSASTPPPHPTPAQLKQARIHELQQQVANMGKHNPGDLTPAQADAMMWPPAKKPVLRGPEPTHRPIDFEHPVLGELDPPVRVSHPLKASRPGIDQPLPQMIDPSDQLPLYDEMIYYGRPRTERMPGIHMNPRQYSDDGVPIATQMEIDEWMRGPQRFPRRHYWSDESIYYGKNATMGDTMPPGAMNDFAARRGGGQETASWGKQQQRASLERIDELLGPEMIQIGENRFIPHGKWDPSLANQQALRKRIWTERKKNLGPRERSGGNRPDEARTRIDRDQDRHMYSKPHQIWGDSNAHYAYRNKPLYGPTKNITHPTDGRILGRGEIDGPGTSFMEWLQQWR